MKLTLILSMLLFFKFCIGQKPPMVFAGVDQVIYYPSNSVMLEGMAVGEDAKIKSFYWEQMVGTQGVSILKPDSVVTFVTGLELGRTYIFKLTATDKLGKYSIDFVTVIVQK